MKRTIIDASQLELNDKVVAIKRVSKTVKGGRTMRFSRSEVRTEYRFAFPLSDASPVTSPPSSFTITP